MLQTTQVDLLLHFWANFLVYWIHIWVLGPQAWLNERGCLPFQSPEMGDADREAVHAQWADLLFRWKTKNLQQISHMTGSWCWVIWQGFYCKFIAEFISDKILKISRRKSYISTNVEWYLFWLTVYIYHRAVANCKYIQWVLKQL